MKMTFARVRIYVLFPPKKCSPFHTKSVSYWFSMLSSVNVWISKYSHHPDLCECQMFQPFTPFSLSHLCVVNTWNTNHSHSFLMKINRKREVGERVNVFLRIKKRIGNSNRWGSEVICNVLYMGAAQMSSAWSFFTQRDRLSGDKWMQWRGRGNGNEQTRIALFCRRQDWRKA